MIRVLIVDDSAVMRNLLCQILAADPEIDVVGVAADAMVAREMIKALRPDVLTLDIDMPKMDGLAFLDRIMQLRPMPVVMISALTMDGADVTLQALEMGAVDFVAKPQVDMREAWPALRDEVTSKIKAAARTSVQIARRATSSLPKLPDPRTRSRSANKIVAIGASTGGVGALMEILSGMPENGPPILVAQHMPASFTRQFAKRLNDCCAMSVAEATDQARVLPGHVYIAPGDRHLSLVRTGVNFYCRLEDGERVNNHIPCVDILFASAATAAGNDGIGVLLTGMGKDGAQGLAAMRKAGAVTACQDEATSAIYGMPKAAMAIGAAEIELPLGRIAGWILERSSGDSPPTRVDMGRPEGARSASPGGQK